MAHLNFTPPPTPSDAYNTDDLGSIPHPMRHVWRHRYSNSQSSSFLYEPHNNVTTLTNDAHDRKAKKLRHRRSTGTVLQNFDSTTSTHTFWNTANITGADRNIANRGHNNNSADVSEQLFSDTRAMENKRSPIYVYSVDDMRGKYHRSEISDGSHYLFAKDTVAEPQSTMARSKIRPNPLNLTESSQQKIQEKISQRSEYGHPIECHSIGEVEVASPSLDSVEGDDDDDEFSNVRDQITAITRELQQMQIQELQIQEKAFDNDRKQRQKLVGISQRGRIQQGRRLSISNSYQIEAIGEGSEPTHRHHRVRSHGSFFSHHQTFSLDSSSAASSTTAISLSTDHQHNIMADLSKDHQLLSPSNGLGHSSTSTSDEDDEVDDDNIYQSLPASPNMTTLLLTTNSLINSRMEEMARYVGPNHFEDKIWQNDFVDVMSRCIHQSEELESLSTDLLKLERQMRELFILKSSVEEQLEQREYVCSSQIEQCNRALSFQRQMITDLESMTIDMDRKIELASKLSNQAELKRNGGRPSNQADDDDEISISQILGLTKKEELVAQLRWEVGRFVGGGVGTGSIIHVYESPNAGHSMIIGGTASTMERDFADLSLGSPSTSKPQHRQYVVHLNSEHREKHFQKLPMDRWVDDYLVDQCQFVRFLKSGGPVSRCPVQFSFFRRKHHCRRCGKIFCHEHSSNQIILFQPQGSSSLQPSAGEWCRVCDKCFFDLVSIAAR